MDTPIHGYVPPPTDPPPPEEPKRRTGWPKGKPRGPKKNALVALPPPPRAPVPAACKGCSRALTPLTLDVMQELLRVARDRLLDDGNANYEVLYLAARVDGFCGAPCWKMHAATDEQASALDSKRRK